MRRASPLVVSVTSVAVVLAIVLPGGAAASAPVCRTAMDAATVSPAAWTNLRAFAGRIGAVSAAVDDNGHVHIAASAANGLVYITDRSGDWVGTQILANVDDGSYESWSVPSIALDETGGVWIAAAYGCFECAPGDSDGIWYVTDAGRAPGRFGARHRLAGATSTDPSLKVHDGHIYLAYGTMGDDGPGHVPVWFKTDATGSWTRERIARDGYGPSLRVDRAGHARIAYSGLDDVRYARATDLSGGFVVTVVPGSRGRSWGDASLALDTAQRPHIAWAGGSTVLYAHATARGWSAITKVASTWGRVSLSVDAANVPHVAIGRTDVLHAWRMGGSWRREIIATNADPSGHGVVVRATPMGLFVVYGRTTDARGVWVARS